MTSAFRQHTARSIPAMRPSYDGEHPVAPAPTPIYDELYSEYRRLFRALPGDRSGEEELRFTGFAVRPYDSFAGYPPAASESYPALTQHQPFAGYSGQLPGSPQFVPPQPGAPGHQAHPPQLSPGYPQAPQSAQGPHTHQSHQPHQSHAPHPSHVPHPQQTGHHPAAHHPGAQQPAAGQGWVASGYLAPVTAVPSPGRHRGNLLSLPPGRS